MLLRYLLLLCLTVSAAVGAQPDLNLSFESSGKNGSGVAGWSVRGGDYASARDTNEYTSGSASLRFTAKAGRSDSSFAFLSTELPLQLAVGRTLELRADIKTETVADGYAGLWVRAGKGSGGGSIHKFCGEPLGRDSNPRLPPAPPTGLRWPCKSTCPRTLPMSQSVVCTSVPAARGSIMWPSIWTASSTYPLSNGPKGRSPAPSAPKRPEVEWLRQYVHPLASVHPGYEDSSDLEAFGRGRRHQWTWSGLGESTHGSHEIFQLKDRLVRYLNRERGFETFALEASMVPCFEATDYVREGVGSPQAILDGLGFWTRRTEELTELLEGIHGAARDRPVRFTGFDMQDYRPRFCRAGGRTSR